MMPPVGLTVPVPGRIATSTSSSGGGGTLLAASVAASVAASPAATTTSVTASVVSVTVSVIVSTAPAAASPIEPVASLKASPASSALGKEGGFSAMDGTVRRCAFAGIGRTTEEFRPGE